MCIIVYKSAEEKFPSKTTLKTCFENNPDGAGFMYAYNKKVYIEKGFVKFNEFWKKLQATRKLVGDALPYVLHFRISTQAGKRPDCTHPYPLSKNMEDLRKLSTTAKIGVAHNGIIELTSYGYSYQKQITYNDTMEFITDYLSLIIQNKDYYKNKDTLKLIERLCGSRLAILDEDGYCQLIGDGWVLDNGIVYSNTSYMPRIVYYKPTKTKETKYTYLADDDEEYEYLSVPCEYGCEYYKGDEAHKKVLNACEHCAFYESCMEDVCESKSAIVEYDPATCPVATDGDVDECFYCKNYDKCYK